MFSKKWARSLLPALFGLALASCAAPLSQGIREYDVGRYPEALAALQRAEIERDCLQADEQTRYALYRGLVELALGNACQAHYWLSHVQRVVHTRPELLSLSDRGRLLSAWQSLGKMPGQLR